MSSMENGWRSLDVSRIWFKMGGRVVRKWAQTFTIIIFYFLVDRSIELMFFYSFRMVI